jgi:hypothetical protein
MSRGKFPGLYRVPGRDSSCPYEEIEEVGGGDGPIVVRGSVAAYAPVHVALELLVARMRSSPATSGAPKRKMSS